MGTMAREHQGDQIPPPTPKTRLQRYPESWDRPLVTVVAGALIASVLGLLIPACSAVWVVNRQIAADRAQQQRQFDVEQSTELREKRRDAYVGVLEAANTWVVVQEDRESCKPGTDDPLRRGAPCSAGYLSRLQSARYDLRGALNEMGYVESFGGNAARATLMYTVPSPAPRDSGPEEGVVHDESFSEAYNLFQDQVLCDTNPDADKLARSLLTGSSANSCDELLRTLQVESDPRTTTLQSPKPR